MNFSVMSIQVSEGAGLGSALVACSQGRSPWIGQAKVEPPPGTLLMISFPRSSAHSVRRPQLRHASYRDDGTIAFAADRSDAETALPQGEAAVLTHLMSAALEAEEIRLSCGPHTVEGALGMPDLDTMEVPFLPLEAADSLRSSGVVTVRYVLAGHPVRFRTRLQWRSTGWRLALPRLIETATRRLSPRHELDGRWLVELKRNSPLAGTRVHLDDAGAGGVSFRVPLEHAPGLEGRVLTGILRDAAGTAVPVQLRVRHLRPAEDPSGDVLVGSSFQGIGFENQRRVAQAIQRDRSRRDGPGPRMLEGDA